MPVLIGTSGWHYPHWRGGIYPSALPAREWLKRYAELFATVELNNAFYRLPEAATFAGWAETLPDDFVVSVKASRFLTHVRRLHEPEEPVRRLMQHARALGPRLGPILLQLPPNLPVDAEALSETLAAFAREGAELSRSDRIAVGIAVEFRHESWFDPAVRRILEGSGVACCLTDRAGTQGPLWRTADWGYVRFHQGRSRPSGCYGGGALATWARRLAELWPATADVFAYFNNDGHGCAPRDAQRFGLLVSQEGLSPTRLPSARCR